MLPMRPLIVVVVALTVCVGAGTACAAVSIDAPGHVCIEGSVVTLRGGEANAEFSLATWRGRRAVRTFAFGGDGTATLPKLPTGYYHVFTGGVSVATFAVVPPPETRVFDHDSFYGVDSAQSWLAKKDKFLCPWNDGGTFRTVSDLIQLAGVPHVRERISPGDVYPKKGVANLSHYLYNAKLLRDRRIKVSDVFAGLPRWVAARKGMATDLVAVRDFCASLATDFGDCMGDFEFWNEPEGHCAVWDYAAAMKAAYFGFRTSPGMPVVPAGLTDMSAGFYLRTLFDNDAPKFADVFNFHTYRPIPDYSKLVGASRELLRRLGLGDRAIWLTEIGTNMEGHSREDGAIPGQKAHSPEQELVVAEFCPKSLIAMQMEGVARTYFFVFCPYNERGGNKDWGMMRRDGTVKPVYAAMGTLTRELVSAKIVGEIKMDEGAKAFLFSQPDGTQTVAFWSVSPVDSGDGEGVKPTPDFALEVRIPAADGTYRVSDMCGMRSRATAKGGTLVLAATRFPSYVSGLRGLTADISAKPAGKILPYVPAADEDLSIVVRVEPDERDFAITRTKTRASLREETGRMRVFAWNLGGEPKTGVVEVAGGRIDGLPKEPFVLGPSTSAVFECTYVPDESSDFERNLVFRGRFNGKMGSRLSMPVWLDRKFLATCETTPLAWNNVESWRRNDSARTFRKSWDSAECAMRFDFEWTGPDNRWCYPYYCLADGETLEGARMISFEVKSTQDKVENDHSRAYVMLGGNLAYAPPTGSWEKRYVELPQDGIADLREFRIGVNPRGHKLTLWIRNVSLLKKQ